MSNYQGIGGSYVVDPATGDMKLVQRTFDPSFPINDQPAPAAAPAPAPAAQQPAATPQVN